MTDRLMERNDVPEEFGGSGEPLPESPLQLPTTDLGWMPAGGDGAQKQSHRSIRMSRWKAAGIHLLLSTAVGTAVLGFMLTVWYPWPLFEAAGGGKLIFLLTAVDVTLGPLITLIIFKSGKKGLKFDLTVIALLQISALAYGIHTVDLARPVYLVFTVDTFELVTARDLDVQDLAQVTDERFKRLPWGRPQYAAAVFPLDPKIKAKVLQTSLAGKDLQMYPQYYVPYEQEAQNALKRAKDVSVLLERDPGAVQGYLRSAGRSREAVKYLPLRGTKQDGAVLVDAVSGAPVNILMVDPW